MSFLRPWRRRVKPLGTPQGNPSVLDDVLAEGPPTDPIHGVPDLGLWNTEKEEAVHADLVQDLGTDMDAEADSEDRVFDLLGHDGGQAEDEDHRGP